MAAWPLASAICSAVPPCWLRGSVLAPACSSSCTHSVDNRLVLEQQAHYGVLALRRSHNESGAALGAAQVDAGTALQQLIRHAQLPTMRGRVQQPDPHHGDAGRRLGCVLPEELSNGGAASELGQLQRRAAVLAAQLGACASL
eukprot:scaffold1159_cov68-Phaeocystis_antarctica.AAC.4